MISLNRGFSINLNFYMKIVKCAYRVHFLQSGNPLFSEIFFGGRSGRHDLKLLYKLFNLA